MTLVVKSLVVVAVFTLVAECHYNQRQCLGEYYRNGKSTKFIKDCFIDDSGVDGSHVEACIDYYPKSPKFGVYCTNFRYEERRKKKSLTTTSTPIPHQMSTTPTATPMTTTNEPMKRPDTILPLLSGFVLIGIVITSMAVAYYFGLYRNKDKKDKLEKNLTELKDMKPHGYDLEKNALKIPIHSSLDDLPSKGSEKALLV